MSNKKRISDSQSGECVHIKDLCAHLNRQKRFDLSLLVIRLRRLTYYSFFLNEYGAKSLKKDVISALDTVKKGASTKQQVAYARWEFLRHQLPRHELRTNEENEERKAIATLFAQNNDHVHEALSLIGGKVAPDTIAYAMVPQMKQQLFNSGNPFAYTQACIREVHACMGLDQQSSFATFIPLLWNIEKLDIARTGVHLHNSNGSASILYSAYKDWITTSLEHKTIHTKMIVTLYIESLVKRAPPSIDRGSFVFGTICAALERNKDRFYEGEWSRTAVSRMMNMNKLRYDYAEAKGRSDWEARGWYYHYGILDARYTANQDARIAKLEAIELDARKQAYILMDLENRTKAVQAMMFAAEACLYNPKRENNLFDMEIWQEAVQVKNSGYIITMGNEAERKEVERLYSRSQGHVGSL